MTRKIKHKYTEVEAFAKFGLVMTNLPLLFPMEVFIAALLQRIDQRPIPQDPWGQRPNSKRYKKWRHKAIAPKTFFTERIRCAVACGVPEDEILSILALLK
jgi:hypothetical protein